MMSQTPGGNRRIMVGAITLAFAATGAAALPAPSAEAKAKGAEAVAKAAWTDKVGAYQTCRVQDRLAEDYRAKLKATGQAIPTPTASVPCADPGLYVTPVVIAAKPLEASGAHSPPENATSPPSSTVPQNALSPAPKK